MIRSVTPFGDGAVLVDLDDVSAAHRLADRLAAIVIPPVMGAIADQWGTGTSFVVLGTVLLVLSAPVALIARRAARVESSAILVQSQTPRTEAR